MLPTRRAFLAAAGAGVALSAAGRLAAADPDPFADIADPEIRAGVHAAITKTLNPAAAERVYPGHFTVTADGHHYGADVTYPGLDGWQLAGAYLLLGRTRLVLDYFDFVRASQRRDGNIPFVVMPGDAKPDTSTYLRGLKYPDDVFTYAPPPRAGRPPQSDLRPKKWVGLFDHWQPKANPLSTLGAVSHILTAAEIHDHAPDPAWLRDRLPSAEAAGRFLLTRRGANGLIGGSGFYTELPPRRGQDGVTQCYVTHAFTRLAGLSAAAGAPGREQWTAAADALRAAFVREFWRADHFAEYIHPDRGVVDAHGLSDVNWAAVGLNVAGDEQVKRVWPRLTAEPAFWPGGMPTCSVTKPDTYEPWEYHEPLPFDPGVGPVRDAAAMGRVWYLEALACRRTGAKERLAESARLVCRAGLKADGFWSERYKPRPDGTVRPTGPRGYCEYPAVLVRAVLGNRSWFGRA
ncbi:MAG TPA: hypothetical protein VGF55_21095 [Gemmataceae bacterium]